MTPKHDKELRIIAKTNQFMVINKVFSKKRCLLNPLAWEINDCPTIERGRRGYVSGVGNECEYPPCVDFSQGGTLIFFMKFWGGGGGGGERIPPPASCATLVKKCPLHIFPLRERFFYGWQQTHTIVKNNIFELSWWKPFHW